MPFGPTFITDLAVNGCSGVYKITQPANGKIYIGSAFDIRDRWNQHCSSSAKNLHQLPFENALRKYGPDSFEWHIIEYINISDLCRKTQRKEIRERLLEAEQRWLDSEQPFWWTKKGYNHNPTAGSPLGRKQTGKAAAGVPRKPHTGLAAKGMPKGGLNKKGARNNRAKWVRFTSPDEKIFTRPLTWFCLSRGLNKGAMAALARGAYKLRSGKILHTYKGWKAEYI